MATELIQKTIDGKRYEFEQFGARLALRTLARLAKIIGRPFVLSMGAFKGKDKPLDTTALGAAAEALVQSLDEDSALELVEKLVAEKALCDGKKIDFDSHYEGKLDHLFRVLKAALEVQYGNFFDALSEFLDTKGPAEKASTLVK